MMSTINRTVSPLLLFAWTTATMSLALSAEGKIEYHFDFSGKKSGPGILSVAPDTVYGRNSPFGYDLNTVRKEGMPFFFSVDVPEGNYRVRVVLGNENAESTTTVKAEARRLMLLNVKNDKGKFSEHFFTVNVRNAEIEGAQPVNLKARELGSLTWDGKLTLEFSGDNPSVSEIEITAVDDLPVIFLAGDSTVVDQTREPWCGWGQALPRLLTPDVVVANHAESGLTAGSFIGSGRLSKIMSQIKAGDYLLIQFGHNDQKETGAGRGPHANYKDNLKVFLDKAGEKGAIPVLVTPPHRRRFDGNGKAVNSHGDYPHAMRQLAREENVALVDLHQSSATLLEAWGDEKSKCAFVHYPKGTFPGQESDLADNSHFNFYGGDQLAKSVVRGMIDIRACA